MDNDNIFKQLENLRVPVSESEWAAIAGDPAVRSKFSPRKSGLEVPHKVLIAVASLCVAGSIIFVASKLGDKVNTSETSGVPCGTAHSTAKAISDSTLNFSEKNPATQTSSAEKTQNNNEFTAYFDDTSISSDVSKRHNSPETDVAVPENYVGYSNSSSDNIKITSDQGKSGSKTEIRNQKITPVSSEQTAYSEKFVSESNQVADNGTFAENDPNELRFVERESEELPETAEYEFFIPSAFTPNGDGLNDLFYVKANFEPKDFDMNIVSKGGDLVFRSRDINAGWDGKFHGNVLSQGMYVYTIRYKDRNGKEQKKQGQVLLLP